jgi:hypothetical protein
VQRRGGDDDDGGKAGGRQISCGGDALVMQEQRAKALPVVYVGVSNDGAVECRFPPLRHFPGENFTPARRMGDDGIFDDVVSFLKVSSWKFFSSTFIT